MSFFEESVDQFSYELDQVFYAPTKECAEFAVVQRYRDGHESFVMIEDDSPGAVSVVGLDVQDDDWVSYPVIAEDVLGIVMELTNEMQWSSVARAEDGSVIVLEFSADSEDALYLVREDSGGSLFVRKLIFSHEDGWYEIPYKPSGDC